MSQSSIRKDLILNGSNSIAAFEEDGAIYRVSPVPIIQEIRLYGIGKNKTKIFKLDDYLTKDYEILGIVADIEADDGNVDQAAGNAGEQATVNFGLRIFQGKKAVDNVRLRLTPYPFYTNKLFINHRDVWHVKADQKINRITFMCRPVYMETPIAFS